MPGRSEEKQAKAARGAARQRLAQRRKALGLTQEALADLIGVERSTVVRWERGQTAPLPWMRPKLARALRVSADRLGELLAPSAPAGPGSSGADAGAGAGGPDAGPRPRQLPLAVAGFTGRTAELQELTKIVEREGTAGPLVISAVGGTAGVGKTALVLQWAHQAADRFPDGQLYVNLRGYDPDSPVPPSDALAGFLWALGVGGQDIPPAEDERAARYRSLLAGQRVLVVLDNAGSADQVRPLLPGSSTCVVLVTSRDSLAGLVARDGAARVSLDLLPLPDAVRLLRRLIGDRAAADPRATRALARQCCRLPLALRIAAELAIARPVVPLADLTAELSDQQRVLDLLDAGGDPRAAIRAVFSWSCQHLDTDATRAFRLAGLHPAADFDAYAVAALTGATLPEARQTLDALSKAHLVEPTEPLGAPGTGRYVMHDLLRAYASELAAAHDGTDGQHAALTRLLDYYLSTAATATSILYPGRGQQGPLAVPASTPAPPLPDAAAAQSWLDSERPALTAVTQHAAGHGWPGHATRLAATLRNYFVFGGHYPEAVLINTSARRAAGQQGDVAADAAALNSLAVIDLQQGRFQLAAERFLAARDLFRRAGDRRGEAMALGNLGAIHGELGRYQEAIGFFEQALNAQRETGARASEAITLGNLGYLMVLQGRYRQAAQSLRECLDVCRETGDGRQECFALASLGEIAFLRGDYGQADDLLRQALRLSRAPGYRHREAMALTKMGELRRRQGRLEEAAGQLREALAIARELGDRGGEAIALNRLGEVQLAAGQPGDARDQHASALGLTTESGDKIEQGRAHEGLGNAYDALGDTGEAGRHWRAARALFTDLGVPEAARVRARLDGMGPIPGPGVVSGT